MFNALEAAVWRGSGYAVFLFEQGWFRRRELLEVRMQKRKSLGSSFSELLTRLELVTSSLPRKCSTTELQQQHAENQRLEKAWRTCVGMVSNIVSNNCYQQSLAG